MNVIEKFYQAFSDLDAESMVACYHDQVKFHDPAFGPLGGERARNMWRMLCDSQRGRDFKVSFSRIEVFEGAGTAHWEAFYTFSRTGRKVHNIINAKFVLRDGMILRHRDDFDLYHWSKHALGITGYLIGWTGYFQRKLQNQTNTLLDKYEQSRSN